MTFVAAFKCCFLAKVSSFAKMKVKSSPSKLNVALLVILYLSQHLQLHQLLVTCCDQDAWDELGKTTAEIVKLRGYNAEDHEVTTTDGYILNVVKATNPLINGGKGGAPGKPPVLFMHGFTNNANIWIVNSVDVEPKDHSQLDVNTMSDADLKMLAEDDKGFHSVAFTFLNFGHEVWLLNRRGTQQSQKHKDKSIEPKGAGGGLLKGLGDGAKAFACIATGDPSKLGEELKKIEGGHSKKYWDFSFDEEAKFDWPETIDYVLKESKAEKVVLVGHSAGGALTITSQVVKPELADKIAKCLLYAPAQYLKGSSGELAVPLLPFIEAYVGPLPPEFLALLFRYGLAAICSTKVAQHTICSSLTQLAYGCDCGKGVYLPGYGAGASDMTSSHEGAHLIQTTVKKKLHKYDHKDPAKNQAAHGEPTPPLYDVGKVKSHPIAIFYGHGDTLVPMHEIEDLIVDFKVPIEKHPIECWNHQSFFFHTEIPEKLTIPSLKFLEAK